MIGLKAATVIYTFKCNEYPGLENFVKSVEHNRHTCKIVCAETEEHTVARMLRDSIERGALNFSFDTYSDSGSPEFTSFHFSARLPHPENVYRSVDCQTEELLFHITLEHIQVKCVKNQFGV